MHDEILNEDQKKLLNLIKKFNPQFGLVGGTAIALHLGHRRSVDFDLFCLKDFEIEKIKTEIKKNYQIQRVFVEKPGEFTLIISNVKITFYKYPFNIKFLVSFGDVINIPDLITLAAMKAYALGRRAKWKDYVDLYFIFKTISVKDVVDKTKELFQEEFNEKLFREQLSYFKDIDYSEEVDYLKGFETSPDIVQESLLKISLQR